MASSLTARQIIEALKEVRHERRTFLAQTTYGVSTSGIFDCNDRETALLNELKRLEEQDNAGSVEAIASISLLVDALEQVEGRTKQLGEYVTNLAEATAQIAKHSDADKMFKFKRVLWAMVGINSALTITIAVLVLLLVV